MNDSLQKPAATPLVKRWARSLGTVVLWLVALAAALAVNPWSVLAIGFGLHGATSGRIRMTSGRDVNGRRSLWLSAAWMVWGVVVGLLSLFEPSPAKPFARLSSLEGFALGAAVWIPVLTLWALGMVWSGPRDE